MGMAKLILDGTEHELPLVVGSESEVGIDIAQLRAQTGAITLDESYGNTGARFTEVAYLFVYGRLPGWIAHWKEMREEGARINRPRQIYIGPNKTPWVPVAES